MYPGKMAEGIGQLKGQLVLILVSSGGDVDSRDRGGDHRLVSWM